MYKFVLNHMGFLELKETFCKTILSILKSRLNVAIDTNYKSIDLLT